MPTVNNRGPLFWSSACGSSPKGATESAASDFPVAALSHESARRSAQRCYPFNISSALGSSPGL
jgi:hypothetical protein